ncbi:MAG: hypothetical protein WC852_07560 [Candidatus Nanoarchaeia archaeon]|jgi:hypothetical protein
MAWINAKHEEDLAGIAARLRDSNLFLSDLDDTLAKSPTKKVAYSFLRRKDMLFNSKFIAWCSKALYQRAVHGRKAKSGLGIEFIEKFIKPQKIETIQSILTPEYAESSLFPYAKEFYSMFPKAAKVIVTRTIEAIAEPYSNALGFDMTLESQYAKRESVDFMMGVFPDLKRFAVLGDSKEDEEMVDYLRFKLKKGSIDTLVSIYVAKSKRKMNMNFDASIGRDYSPLVELVKKYSNAL